MTEAQRLAREATNYFSEADAEGRDLTTGERNRVQACLDGVKRIQANEQISRLNGGMPDVMTDGRYSYGGGPGDRFVASQGWKSISDPASRGQQWSTGAIEVGFQTKAGTVLESGQGAGFTVTPEVVPGVVSKLFEQIGVADLFAQGQTTAASIRYITEGTATSGAAGVAEGGTKPASDLAYSTVDEAVKKIATVLTVSDELLEDAVSIQSYLNSRLNLFTTIEEERQLLRGAGTNELVGIFGRSGINQYTKLAADDNAVGLLKVLNGTRGSAFVEPDAIIMHPTNWLSTRLLRDGAGGTIGQFYGGGPFSAAYGGQSPMAGAFVDTLWNKPVVLSTVVGVGTALVGSFGQAAQIMRRGGRTVEASNQHASYFQQNLVMLRGESRAALCVYRPVAFTEVRGLA
jgi:HK97 family phage major capsid protein